MNALPFCGTAVLALVACGLAYQFMQPTEDRNLSLNVPDPAPLPTNPGNPGAAQPLQIPRPDIYYAPILDRPLFAPARRPNAATPEFGARMPPAPEPATTIVPPDVLVLSGILGGAQDRTALLGYADAPVAWKRRHDTIGGWTISEIGPDWVVLSIEDRTHRLELFE